MVSDVLCVTVVQGLNDLGVTYTSTHICALKGSTVDIHCTYSYPSRINNVDTAVDEILWFTKESNNEPVDLKTDSEYTGRVQYHCDKNDCTLRIADLRESDSAQYHFTFKTRSFEWRSSLSGTTLTVRDPNLQVQVGTSTIFQDFTRAELKCHSSCRLPDRSSFIWYQNGEEIQNKTSSTYEGYFYPTESYSCAVQGHEDYRSPSVYGPKLPSVSVSPSGEIIEGSSVTLTCSSDANPAAKYTWYKKNVNPDLQPLRKEPQLVISSIQSSNSGEYYCTAENQLGKKTSEYIIDMKYAPKLPSVSVSPSAEIVEDSSLTLTCSSDANPAAKYTWYKKNVNPDHQTLNGPKIPSVSVIPSTEIVEGSSVNLTCSSDANPAANYTWYKDNQTLLPAQEGYYKFTSISSEDRGMYYCKSENQYGQITSLSLFIDVLYAPKLPSVSVSPSGEIIEGSSVNLTCSSDANPAANYTWYKENEDSPKASGQIFTITDVRPEHSGNYYCEAQNRRGRHNSTLHLIVVKGTGKSVAAGVTAAVLLLVIILSVFLWMRKKRASNQSSEAEERPDDKERTQPAEQDNILYASVVFSNNQADPLYSNIGSAQLHRHMEEQEVTEYAAVKFNRAGNAPRTRGQQTWEDPAALYSTVNKTS
ncbi:B-cell receptor CD22-like [Scomber scombrus]|uniref:B-cell receptor CD22-like n=1 Tax=Scomber scombrus TaxID=13677 RepID=UPI002DDBF1B6|nr:B-cell receptor CD22-like [Scomber scombrus]